MKCCFGCCYCCCCSCCCCYGCYWSHKPTFKVWLKSGQEQLRYWWHWVCGGWWWWWWSKVIFVSNPTLVMLGWVVLTTNKILKLYVCQQTNYEMKQIWILYFEYYFLLFQLLFIMDSTLGKGSKNDRLAMKRILYDMGPLTLVRWPL